jgi:ubiquinone/menaquinone biosynthesis C-methylase UbiE
MEMAKLQHAHWWFVGRGEVVRSLVEKECALRGGPVRRLVDVGSGTGAVLASFQGLADETVGIELDETALGMSRELGLDVRQAPADELPFPDQSVDIVTAFDVLEHLDDDLGAAREFRRVLEPDGTLVVTVPAYQFLWSAHDVAHAHARRYTRPTLTKMLRAAGLEIRQSGYFMTALFPLAVVQRLTARFRKEPTEILTMPPRRLNALLLRILRAERRRVLAGGFPFGLTVFAVAGPAK